MTEAPAPPETSPPETSPPETSPPETSHREILRSSSIVGGAAAFNIVATLVKTKLVAVLLGPLGVGLIVLLQSVMQTYSAVVGLSLGSVGTRQIAEASGADDARRIAVVRRALFWAMAVLTVAGALVFLVSVPWTTRALDGSADIGGPAAWLAIGIALSVVGQWQSALLTGYRRIGDLAKSSILTANIAAAAGIIAVFIWGNRGILAFVLAPMVVTIVIGQFYVRRLPAPPRVAIERVELKAEWSTMLGLGIALTFAAAVVTAGHLAARMLIQRELGAAAVGYFQASWLVSVTYIGFVLQAMGTDFYPRITAAIHDPAAANTMVNEQTEVALLLAAPVMLGAMGAAPWIVPLLYSHAFAPAVAVLQWQVLGDVLKVASWPLGFLLLASGAGRAYMIGELLAVAVLLAALALLLPLVGLQAGGLAVTAMYLFYLPCVYAVARVRTGFRWSALNLALLAALAGAAIATLIVSRLTAVGGGVLGVTLAAGAGMLCLWRLRDALPGPVGAVVARVRRMVMRDGT